MLKKGSGSQVFIWILILAQNRSHRIRSVVTVMLICLACPSSGLAWRSVERSAPPSRSFLPSVRNVVRHSMSAISTGRDPCGIRVERVGACVLWVDRLRILREPTSSTQARRTMLPCILSRSQPPCRDAGLAVPPRVFLLRFRIHLSFIISSAASGFITFSSMNSCPF